MYQEKSISNRYYKTNNKYWIIFPSYQVLATLLENIKWIMISKLENDRVGELELSRLQKRKIFQDSVKLFQNNRVEENEWGNII